ncbi:MAG: hypothetical protein PHV95_12030 [Eubacteriales bacterium]|nr:hypothetical protein [Eubacteriales bacterium]
MVFYKSDSGNNLSNKLKEDNFSEKELLKIADILGCEYKAAFIMTDTGKEI